jgi:hypothetical protein
MPDSARTGDRARCAIDLWAVAQPSLVSRRLLQSDFVEVEVDYARRIVVLRRSSNAFRNSAEVDQTIAELAKAVPDRVRAGHQILIDMRGAPVRANPELDTAFERYRAETERGFERVAVLVESTLGKIRSDRLKQTAKAEVGIFLSLDEALSWLIER